jgi:carbonic anhydrase
MLTANQTYYTHYNLSAETALQKLMEGNDRYVLDHVEHPHEGAQRRVDLSGAQHPFAIVLGCADSRVVPELIFDQGVGDLFVLRVAGNVADDAVIASIEYAVEHLGTRLVVVLGHERCGAVMAAIDHAFSEGKLNSLISYIEPAVKAGQLVNGDCVVSDTIKAHVNLMVKAIASTRPILSHEVANRTLKVVPAYYRLTTGKVDFLDLP